MSKVLKGKNGLYRFKCTKRLRQRCCMFPILFKIYVKKALPFWKRRGIYRTLYSPQNNAHSVKVLKPIFCGGTFHVFHLVSTRFMCPSFLDKMPLAVPLLHFVSPSLSFHTPYSLITWSPQQSLNLSLALPALGLKPEIFANT